MIPHADSIVFTGISGSFGGAATPRALWKAILHKQSFFVPFGESEGAHISEDLFPAHTMPEVCAALGDNFACRSDMMPDIPEVSLGDNPDFWFAAQLIFDALNDAGMPPGSDRTDRVALYVGYDSFFNPAAINWFQHATGIEQLMTAIQRFVPAMTGSQAAQLRTELAATLPRLRPSQLDAARGDDVVRRLAQTVTACDTACLCSAGEASVFTGLEAAANALRANQCDAAVVVAVQPPILMPGLLGEAVLTPFTTAHELSPFTDGTCGTLPGEGGAAFVLRRGSDARDDGSRCYARLHGCGMVSGLPSTEDGLRESLRRALHRALRRMPNGFRDIDYWEMNASGIPEEDAAEEALLNAATANRGAHIPLLAVGSAKTAFGNTFTAAGALGLLKGLLALNHCILPPSVTPVDDTFRLKLPERAYYWVQEARPWIASSARPRRLAVSTVSRKGRAGAAILEAMPDE